MHLFSSEHNLLGGFAFIGEGIPVALGAAFQSRYAKTPWGRPMQTRSPPASLATAPPTTASFFECLNMAALLEIRPYLFVVENNKWAIGMAHERATSQPEIYRKAASFDMPGIEVDGMDKFMAVRTVAQEAIARARPEKAPL